jgi:diacylglycerol kinase family enzyme
MKRIGIILNANAKQFRRGNISADRLKQIGAELIDLRITSTFEELDASLRNFRKANYPYISIAGGDGTIHQVLTRLIKIYGEKKLPAVVLLKGGTMDNIARSVKLRGNGAAILKRLVHTLRQGKEPEIVVRDTIRIDDRYCSLFGIGAVINFLKEAYSGKEKGVKQNLKTIVKTIRQAIWEPDTGYLFQGVEAGIAVNGTQIGFNHITAILAATVKGVGLGFYPLSKALDMPGSFHALIIGINGRQIISYILHLKNGWEIAHPLVCDVIAEKLTIRSSVKFTYTMDGDLYESDGKLVLTVGPGIGYVRV